ncbi:MAG: NAD(P)/FAD-dependent oxidoreductase [Acidimicrobiia bacterium]|nr:NAD(P)/FAD-dependent oxidoreductase [Acidimicrobiia bacterium]
MKDVTIIGGGVIGCAIARELTRYRLDVLLVESEVEVGFGTSKSNSGIIHGGHHTEPGTLKGELAWAGNQRWVRLAQELGFGFRRNGDLTVAFDESDVEVLERIALQGRERDIPGVEIWGPERIRLEEPNLNQDIIAAVDGPTAGVVNPYEACFALIECAVANGLELRVNAPVTAIEQGADGLLVHAGGDEIPTRFVINAAGVHAEKVARMVGLLEPSIRGRKGEEYLLDKRLAGIVQRTIFPCPTPNSKGILVIPTFDGTIMVGPTAQAVEDLDDVTTTAVGAASTFDLARRLVPGISERDCIAEFAGVRAVAADNDFVIGPTSVAGFFNAAGIQSPGLTAAPAIAELLVTMLGDAGLDLSPRPEFRRTMPRPVHAASISIGELTELAERDRDFARVVCRCELVTEAEIHDAIRRGARTLDGLKFRTRAGMGRCQGGFCTPRCMQLLAADADGGMSDITKRGDGSWLVLDRGDLRGEEVPA